jgi:hypothetical protein
MRLFDRVNKRRALQHTVPRARGGSARPWRCTPERWLCYEPRMRCPTPALLFVVASAAACGGRVDDSAPTATSGSNAPANAPAATGCAGACDRVRACTTPFEERDTCIQECDSQFPDPVRASIYGSCIEALTCDAIVRGLSMDYGPFGVCYSKASGR